MAMSSTAPRRTRLDADDRREQIVAAAQELFARSPYDAVSIGDIAAAAGTTRTNIHYYFTTKRDLFLEIVERFSRIPEEHISNPTGALQVEERVEVVFTRWLDVIDNNRATFMTLVNASSSSDPQVSGVLGDSMRAWERRLLRIVRMDAENPAHRAMIRSFQALITAATTEWLHDGTLKKQQVHGMLSGSLIALSRVARSDLVVGPS